MATYYPPYARMRQIAYNTRFTLNTLSNETPTPIGSAEAGTSSLAARADHSHGGFDPDNRINDGHYILSTTFEQADGAAGNTEWSVSISAGRTVIGGVAYYLAARDITAIAGEYVINTGSNLLAEGERIIAAIIVRVDGGTPAYGAVLSTAGVTTTAPTDEEILSTVGHNGWVRLGNVEAFRDADLGTPGAHAALEIPGNGPVIQAVNAGAEGNLISITFIATGGFSLTRQEGLDGSSLFTFEFTEGVTTFNNFASAVGSLAGADALIEIRDAAPSGIAVVTAFAETNLAGAPAGQGSAEVDVSVADTGVL